MESLNPLQLDILKLFRNYESERDLLDLKQVLIDYLSKRVVNEADKAFLRKDMMPLPLNNGGKSIIERNNETS